MYRTVDKVPGIEMTNNIFPLLKMLGLEEKHIGKNIVSRSFAAWG